MSIKNYLLLIMKTFTHTYNNKFDTSGFKQVKIITFHGLTFESRSNFELYYNKSEHRLVYEVYDECAGPQGFGIKYKTLDDFEDFVYTLEKHRKYNGDKWLPVWLKDE